MQLVARFENVACHFYTQLDKQTDAVSQNVSLNKQIKQQLTIVYVE